MMDVWMVLTLGASFALVAGLIIGCGRIVEDTGGDV